MSESGNSLDKPWVGKIFFGTLIVGILIGWDYKFLPYWVNGIPVLSWFVGFFLLAVVGGYMKRGVLFKTLRPLTLFLSTVVTLFLLVDRFADFSAPEIVPAHVTRLYEGNFLALSSWGVDAVYPDGTTEGVGGGHFQFDFTPTPGMEGKAIIGRGLFGIRYIERLEFDPNAPKTK